MTAFTGFPVLSLLLLSMPATALLIGMVADARKARWIALGGSVLALLLVIRLLLGFDAASGEFQFVEQASWIPSLNVKYLVGVDGISILFLPFTILLFTGVILASWNSVRTLPRLYFSLLMLLQGLTLGIFVSMDLILFFLFWELSLAPLYFLISLWGLGPNRRYAAVKYTLMMLAGGVPLLFGFLLLGFAHADSLGAVVPAGLAFDYPGLLALKLPHHLESLVFFLLLLGFLVKTPAVPFHTWLPVVSMEGPVAVAALMTGLKLGAYGIIRFAVPLAPNLAQEFHWLLAGLGVTGILYGALLALAQTNLRQMLACSSISHVGLVLLAIASFNQAGIQGALFQLLNFTMVAGGLFLLTGFLYQRTGSTDIISLGGAAATMPRLAGFFLLFGLASMGVPGTNGFPAEFLMLMSALESHTGAGLAALAGVVIGAGYFLRLYRQAFFGPVESKVVREAMDLRPRELFIIGLFALFILLNGLFPQGILDFTHGATDRWLGLLGTSG
ncbi:complex I subunit 4 family protein [Thiolapillus sp.]|uniref:complex I subunit 4 family protein n=1 Tax=Thiolapillus sp. TaxID=2017437 RepID=UPI00263ADE25|nr:NADH-quinone oxidoreductase subunit M [Thiolapillus sp.]